MCATFSQPGVYAIYCNIHARMVSYVIAVPGRHVVRANPDGRFALVDVPVGLYRLHVWHERAVHLTQEISVTATGATVQLALEARERTGFWSSALCLPASLRRERRREGLHHRPTNLLPKGDACGPGGLATW